MRAPRYPARAYGERLAVTGELETPPIFEGFSYKYLYANRPAGAAGLVVRRLNAPPTAVDFRYGTGNPSILQKNYLKMWS
jgi:hypothetical protein